MNRILQTLTLFALFMVFSTYIQAQCVVKVKQPSKLTAAISGTTDICSGDSATITIILKGGRAPWTIEHPGLTTPKVVGDDDGVNDTTFTYTYQQTYTNTTGAPIATTYDTTTVTVTDSRGCTSSIAGSAVITVNPIPTIDATAPTEVCPGAPIVLKVTNPNSVTGATFSWTATDGTNPYGSGTDVDFGNITINTKATDCNKTITVTLTPKGPGTTYCVGTPPITRDIIVRDIAAPVITVPTTDLTMQCFDAAAVKEWTDSAKANDNCDGAVTVTASYTAPTTNCNQTVEVTFTSTDACNNTATATKSFTVKDDTKPVLITEGTFPVGTSNIDQCYVAEANGVPTGAEGPTVDAIRALYKDNCTATADLTVEKSRNDTKTSNCDWEIVYTYTIKDACGNTVSPSPTVTYSGGDKTPPVITVPTTDLTMQCFDAAAVKEWTDSAKANDNCDGTVTVTASYTAPTTNCNQIVEVTFTSTDVCNNTATAKKSFTVNDDTKPVIITAGTFPEGTKNINQCYVAEANGVPTGAEGPTIDEIRVLYKDNCTATADLTVEKSRNDTKTSNCDWEIVYTYTIKDACGNTVNPSPTVTYSGGDKTPPVITVPTTDLTMQCFDAAAVKEWTDSAKANDNCDGAVTVTASYTAPTTNCNQTVEVTFTSTDACNNTAIATKSFTVNDDTKPEITCVGNQSRTVPGAVTYIASGNEFDPTATSDNCDTNPVLSYELSGATTVPSTTANTLSGVVFKPGTTSVTWKLTDACGNYQTCTFTVSVSQFSFTFLVTDLSCFESGDGKIVVTAVGGVEPIQFSKNDGATWESSDSGTPRTKTFDNLSAGDYPIKIKDANGVETTVCSAP